MLRTLTALSAQLLILCLLSSIHAFPFQPNAPTSLSLVTLNSTILSSSSPIVNEHPCFGDQDHRPPTNLNDCSQAISAIHRSTDSRRYTFSRGRQAQYPLPKSYSSGTCQITLDMIYDEQVDRLTFPQIQHAALILATRCTDGPIYRAGGVGSVGPDHVMYITILGMKALDVS